MDARRHVWRTAPDRIRLSPGCRAVRGPAEALAPAPRIRFEPRPGGRPGLAATADVAMAMYGPDGAARAGLPGWRTPLCSCRRPLQFQGQGDRRQAIRQLVTGADGVG